MNKLKLLCALIALVMIACADDDDVKKPTFKQADFYGTWEQYGTESDGCTDIISIDEFFIDYGTMCDSEQTFVYGYSYDFKNNSISHLDMDYLNIKYVIKSTTAASFEADFYRDNVKIETQTFVRL